VRVGEGTKPPYPSLLSGTRHASTGRGSNGEQVGFSGFSTWPTKRQPSLYPARGMSQSPPSAPAMAGFFCGLVIRDRAIRRAGELLKQIEPAPNQHVAGKGAHTSRSDAAREAGMQATSCRGASRPQPGNRSRSSLETGHSDLPLLFRWLRPIFSPKRSNRPPRIVSTISGREWRNSAPEGYDSTGPKSGCSYRSTRREQCPQFWGDPAL